MSLFRRPSNDAAAKLQQQGLLSWIIAPSVALVALTGISRSQSLPDVSLTYLQRHGGPCTAVMKVDTTIDLDQVATCQDGSEWVLFWIEDEIAFVQPGSHQLYRWRRDVHTLHPYLYGRSKQISDAEFAGGGEL